MTEYISMNKLEIDREENNAIQGLLTLSGRSNCPSTKFSFLPKTPSCDFSKKRKRMPLSELNCSNSTIFDISEDEEESGSSRKRVRFHIPQTDQFVSVDPNLRLFLVQNSGEKLNYLCLPIFIQEETKIPENSVAPSLTPSNEMRVEPSSMTILQETTSKKPNISVQFCQEFGQFLSNETEALVEENVYGLRLRAMFTEDQLMQVAANFFGENQASQWKLELQRVTEFSRAARASYLTRQCQVKNPRVKAIFQLLQCSDFFYSESGQEIAKTSLLPCFINDFESSLLRVLVPRSGPGSSEFSFQSGKETAREGSVRWKNQQQLLATLPLAYFCVSHLMQNGCPLEHNLCQYLLLVSCLESRGVYHYRASNNLSLAHKSYRYLIERVGGKSYKEKSFESCERAEKEILKTFEVCGNIMESDTR